jgi:AmmeMemoRadiSam system protein A
MSLTQAEKGILLLYAREYIRASYSNIPLSEFDFQKYPNLQNPGGAFVTLTRDGDLRGCIGYVMAQKPLYQTIGEVSLLAATEDPRFLPLQEEELPDVLIEISVLSVPEALTDYDNITTGKHGLILNEPDGQGLLLPQVATEQNMNREEFLTAICQKAGLPANEWRKRTLNLFTFTAEVFGERKRRDFTGERH